MSGGLTVLVVCLMSLAGHAFGQGLGLGAAGGAGILNDPFTFYYAVYLPNQQLQSLRSTPMDSINSAMVTRQYYAQQDRRNLYNPISPYSENYDPLHPYSRQQGSERIAAPYRFANDPSNSDGTGPSLYYGRAASYFPGLAGREPRGRNANIYTRGGASRPAGNYTGRGNARGGGGGMGGGMGGMGMGGMGMGGMGMGGMGMGGMGGMM